MPPKGVSSGGRLCLCSEWNGEQDGAAGGGHRMKRRESRELLPTPHLLCTSPSHAPCPLSLTTVLLSRGCYAHISDVDTEAPRSKLASLESHGQKVEVQGSGPRTQAVYMEPGPMWTVKTSGKQRRGCLPDDPPCVFHGPAYRTAEAGWTHYTTEGHRPPLSSPSVFMAGIAPLSQHPSTQNSDTASARSSHRASQ